jgi:hypothetical protein
MPSFKLKEGLPTGDSFNLRGTVFVTGEPRRVDDAMAQKCRTLGFFEEVEDPSPKVETKASPSLFDLSVGEQKSILANARHPESYSEATTLEVLANGEPNTDASVRGAWKTKKKGKR